MLYYLYIIGIYFDVQEITPNAVGVHRYDSDGKQVKKIFSITLLNRIEIFGIYYVSKFVIKKLTIYIVI